MHKKNLTPQSAPPVNRITIQDVATQFAELSDKDLQQIVGAGEPVIPSGGNRRND
jgi:bacteriocin-like protein